MTPFTYIALMKFRLAFFFLLIVSPAAAQPYTRQDTLRGSNGRGRDWWDVLRYDLSISIDTATKTISGTNNIRFRIISEPRDSIQIDLQEGLELDYEAMGRETEGGKVRHYTTEGNVVWITNISKHWKKGETRSINISFKGKPRIAKNPPWDGGFIWTKDSTGKTWIAVACQGLGASSWWPCKDYQGDEPDSGMIISFPNFETGIIANGREVSAEDSVEVPDPRTGNITLYVTHRKGGTFIVRNPINTYSTTFYIGDYAHWHDTLHGEKGVLDLDFYPLKHYEARARKHWAVTKEMLHCFEYWMGPYPFYEDGYKLVEAPYLGMEHQSAVAYGNQYKMGYLGRDRSGTGVGLAFDFIIVHESGHEWFGNNITAQDIADNWLHEGFTTYTETLFAEWIKGRDSAFAYAAGEWKNIRNDRPVIGDYGVNKEGSGDMYDKGAAVVHMIRMMINDDQKFRQLLRGLNKDFYHKIVTSKEVEDYISKFVGRDLKPFFDIYLRSAKIPEVSVQLFHDGMVIIRLDKQYDALSIPIYTTDGKFVCDLSTKDVFISLKKVNAFRNYLLVPASGVFKSF